MPDILVYGNVYQPTSLGTNPGDQFANPNVYQGTSQACIVDLTPPTFAGISTVSNQSLGQVRATWPAATDATLPLRYEVYIQPGTSVGIFSALNIVAITDKLQYDIFTLPNGTLLISGTTYYVGIRALDGVGNRSNNTQNLSIVSVGISAGGASAYEIQGAFSLNSSAQLTASFWVAFSEQVITDVSRLGAASYLIYDRDGNLVSGMSETGITPDSNGIYEITPVASTLAEDLSHYVVKITAIADSVPRTSYLPIIGKVPDYRCKAIWSINALNQLQGSLFIEVDGEQRTTGLGTASYQILNSSGTAVSGLTQSGITADSNGYFHITPVSAVLLTDLTHFLGKITITCDGKTRTATKGFTLLGN